ncbi:MAG: GNAT family N-acetyltransferase [Clostridiales bacterium]|jgi:GNAT superfamily N-acetyltransferase|nr:GNAT family N-acetyltransferase [Clostridiales bacterium]
MFVKRRQMRMLEVIKCTSKDYGKLVELKKQLSQDEQDVYPLRDAELEASIKRYLSSGYQAVLFVERKNIVGYALVKMNVYPYCLREFFIRREYRKKAYGKECFSRLLDYLRTNTINVDTASKTHMRLGFWKSLGFKPGSIIPARGRN